MFNITVPRILNPQTIETSTFNNPECGEGRGWTCDNQICYIECEYTSGYGNYQEMSRQKFKTVTFLIKPSDIRDTRRTTQIIGTASYSYKTTKDTSVQIAAGPFA